MNRGDIYRISKPPGDDPKKYRYFVIVSRDILIESQYSTVICAPIYSAYHGLVTQVLVGTDEGVVHESSIHCDGLISIPKRRLTHFIGRLPFAKLNTLSKALAAALSIYADELD